MFFYYLIYRYIRETWLNFELKLYIQGAKDEC
nr:MAG TPA: hypothetical protein [Caudoviricetes sp.]